MCTIPLLLLLTRRVLGQVVLLGSFSMIASACGTLQQGTVGPSESTDAQVERFEQAADTYRKGGVPQAAKQAQDRADEAKAKQRRDRITWFEAIFDALVDDWINSRR